MRSGRIPTAWAATVLLVLLAVPAAADVDATPARVAGGDRYETAAEIARLTFGSGGEPTVLLARGDAFPDALAAAGLAGAVRSPILLTEPDSVPQATAEVIDDLGVEQVLLLGGPSAIREPVADQLRDARDVRRLEGPDRYATAATLARELAAIGEVGELDGRRTAVLASGEVPADALAAGPLAYVGLHPVLLTRPDRLPAATREVLAELDVEQVLLAGGPAAVSDDVAEELAQAGVVVRRVAGADRGATAAELADLAVEERGFPGTRVLLAAGDAWPDALAAGPRGGQITAPILLSRGPDHLDDDSAAWLADACPQVEVVQAVGGRDVLSAAALAAAVDAAESCATEPERTLTYETGVRGDVGGDLGLFRQRVAEALDDERGWSLGGDLGFVEVDDGGDLRIWLAAPEVVADAAPVCSPEYSCRVGDDVYINDVRWREATETYRSAGRSLTEYRWYVVNHEVGHWLGLGHLDCPAPGAPAPVMQQQSISLEGCATQVWPLDGELDEVRGRWLD